MYFESCSNSFNFLTRKYSNQHDIIFNSNTTVKGDSAPDWNGNELNINPEQTLAASLSSCHMMTFLALAAKMSWPVTSYRDKAIATLGKNSKIDFLSRKFIFFDDFFFVRYLLSTGKLEKQSF